MAPLRPTGAGPIAAEECRRLAAVLPVYPAGGREELVEPDGQTSETNRAPGSSPGQSRPGVVSPGGVPGQAERKRGAKQGRRRESV